jgi:hypothetical protein
VQDKYYAGTGEMSNFDRRAVGENKNFLEIWKAHLRVDEPKDAFAELESTLSCPRELTALTR